MPDGFALDNAENPGGIKFGAPGSYELSLAIKEGRELICTRIMTFGKEGMLAYPRESYPNLKALFDEVHRHDDTTISFKQGVAVKQP